MRIGIEPRRVGEGVGFPGGVFYSRFSVLMIALSLMAVRCFWIPGFQGCVRSKPGGGVGECSGALAMFFLLPGFAGLRVFGWNKEFLDFPLSRVCVGV